MPAQTGTHSNLGRENVMIDLGKISEATKSDLVGRAEDTEGFLKQ